MMTRPETPTPLRALVSLARVVMQRDGRAPLHWLIDVTLLASVSLLVLHSTTAALAAHADERLPARELFMFAGAVLVYRVGMQRTSMRVLDAMAGEVGAVCARIVSSARRLDLQRFEAIGPRAFVARLADDANRIVPGSNVLVMVAVAALTVALAMLYIAAVSPRAAVIALATMVGLAAVLARTSASAARVVAEAARGRERLRTPIGDLIDGFAQVKQHQARSDDLAAAFDAESRRLEAGRRARYAEFYGRDAASRQGFFALVGFVGFGVPLLAPEAADQIGALVIAVTFVFRPVTTVIMALPQLVGLADAWRRLHAFAEQVESEAAAEAPAVADGRPFEALELRGVGFTYPGGPARPGFAVGPIDFDLRPGEVVFVTGANGSGKSTFVKLLCGLYLRERGSMRLDGDERPPEPGQAWRDLFAAVFAEFVLFERIYGLEDVDPARVQALLDEMELTDKVRFSDGRFDTLALSTGQRKRLALVVALLQDRPILVFDEWAADQDPRFRTRFYRRILPELRARGRAVVAVTHDDDAFDACDRRVHFEDGRMVTR